VLALLAPELKLVTWNLQEEYETHDRGTMRKRSMSRSDSHPTRGEPCAKIARNIDAQEQPADIPLTPDGLLRCRVTTWQDRKYADLRKFREVRASLSRIIQYPSLRNPFLFHCARAVQPGNRISHSTNKLSFIVCLVLFFFP
jgi:hypothetical protein